MGKIGRGKTFFFIAFGETTKTFREMLLMPEHIVRYRYDCEACGETDRWRDALYALSPSEVDRFKVRLIYNDFKITDENQESRALRKLLSFYEVAKLEVPKISDERRKKMVAEFDEQWGSVPARLTEADIESEMLDGEKWVYRLDSTKKNS